MTYSFLREAQLEFHRATIDYEERRVGLGAEFADELERAIQNILRDPPRFPRTANKCRSCR